MLKYVKILLVGSCFLSGVVFADSHTIGVVNTKDVIAKSARIKAESDKLKQRFEAEGNNLNELRKQLVSDIAKMRKNASVMSKKKQQKAQAKLVKREQELNQKQMAFSKKIIKAQQEVMSHVRSDLESIAKNLAKSQKLSLVLDNNGQVLYASPQSDLTDLVKRKFN